MEKYLAFVTIDVWTMIFTWVNLLILFLLMKKFLFKPVRNIIEKRAEEISNFLSEAHSKNEEAGKLKEEYTKKLSAAKDTAEDIIKTATRNAQLREEEIIKDAHKKATDILERAEVQIEQQKKAALSDIKNEISHMATSIASKIIEKDINENDHTKLIDEFIDEMGDTL